MDFYKWLLKQLDRKDMIGRFARNFQDVSEKRLTKKHGRRRKVDTHKRWADIITRRNHRYVPVFNEAWQEFQQDMEAATS
ncbi:MAG: hypothetical protein KDE51_07505 [Anaerolineales bacterium]|nr:hypothetical protein [Anaerolineales bacterium]